MKETMNEGYTAVPKDYNASLDIIENDSIVEGMEYGDMNEADARASGYISGPSPAPVRAFSIKPLAIGFVAGLAALLLLRRRT